MISCYAIEIEMKGFNAKNEKRKCKTPTLLNVIMVVVELIRGPMIEARVD